MTGIEQSTGTRCTCATVLCDSCASSPEHGHLHDVPGVCEHGDAHLTDLGASGMGCGVCADMELDAHDQRVLAGLDVPRVPRVQS